MTLIKKFYKVINNYIKRKPTPIDFFITCAFDHFDQQTQQFITYKFTGGSYKLVPSIFFVSIETFYRKIRQFLLFLTKLLKQFNYNLTNI